MASLTKDRGGWVVLYVDRDGKRRSFYPGKMPRKAAEGVTRHLEHLIAAQKARTVVPGETVSWVADCGDVLRQKLHRHGLIDAPAEAEAAKSVSIGDFTKRYIADRADVKESSKTVWGRCRRLLLKFFSEDRGIETIGLGDAKDFRQWMLREVRGKGRNGLMENTARKMCSVASQFFTDAVDRGLVEANPFDHKDIPRTTKENRARDFFVTREMAAKVLAACPDAERRVIFALSRFGGLRCPSEHLSLKWPDVKWSEGRIVVTSPKTEHHDGKGSREIPLFPELRTHLEELYAEAEDKTGYVINRTRTTETNLRSIFMRIIEEAGLSPWPKLFHNLRATRETELAGEFPIHVVCKWIGNSISVASRNYLQVRPEDFSRAAGEPDQNPDQHTPAGDCSEMQTDEQHLDLRKKKPREPMIPLVKRDSGIGRYRTRTCDPFRVKEVR